MDKHDILAIINSNPAFFLATETMGSHEFAACSSIGRIKQGYSFTPAA